jgi:hypothetical protein
MCLVQNIRLALRYRIIKLLVALASLELVVGCDTGPQVAQVQGTVTYKGVLVPTGTVTFHPVDGGRTAVGVINKDGTYSLSRTMLGDGVVVGEYKVTIEATEAVAQSTATQQMKSVADEMHVIPDARTPTRPKELVPVKYSSVESADLTATVSSGLNQIDFKLP